ncbi:hypothetical protein DRQ36_05280 [bacterium]|nr:MAG: hypothetical protein DRQ36_05280 [bacterium]
MPAKQICILVLFSILAITTFSEGIHWYAGIGGGWGVATLKLDNEDEYLHEYEPIDYWTGALNSFRFSSKVSGGMYLSTKLSAGFEITMLQEAGSKEYIEDCGVPAFEQLRRYAIVTRYTDYSLVGIFEPIEIGLKLRLSLGWGTFFNKITNEFPETNQIFVLRRYADGPSASAGINYTCPIYNGLNIGLGMDWYYHWYARQTYDNMDEAEMGILYIELSWNSLTQQRKGD